MDYPEWLIGSWVADNNEKNIWTFNADGSGPYEDTSYVVIEKVLAITGNLESAKYFSTETHDMIVSKDNQVLILRQWGGRSRLLRKK